MVKPKAFCIDGLKSLLTQVLVAELGLFHHPEVCV